MRADLHLPATRPRPQRGLVLIALLLMLMLVSVGALAAAEVWSTARRHEREVELLWVGDQYRRAIESYWKISPGRRALPASIDQLLTDDRFPNPVHHLRQAYRDPVIDGDTALEPIVVNNALVGVHSTSKDSPLKQANFPRRYQQFSAATDYSQWTFIFVPPNAIAGPPMAPITGPLPGTTGRK